MSKEVWNITFFHEGLNLHSDVKKDFETFKDAEDYLKQHGTYPYKLINYTTFDLFTYKMEKLNHNYAYIIKVDKK